MVKKQKVFEITDDTYKKIYVRGIKSDTEAVKLGKEVMGKNYWGISYYDDYPSKYGNKWKHDSLTIAQFKRLKWRYKN